MNPRPRQAPKPAPKPPASPELVELAREVVERCGSIEDAARTLGVSESAMQRWLDGSRSPGEVNRARLAAVRGGDHDLAARELRIERYAEIVEKRGGWARGYLWENRPAKPIAWLIAQAPAPAGAAC